MMIGQLCWKNTDLFRALKRLVAMLYLPVFTQCLVILVDVTSPLLLVAIPLFMARNLGD